MFDEELLTEEDIQIVLKEAKDPIYSQSNLLQLGKEKTSIFKVSTKTGLSLVNGNEWTGRKHIDYRHSPTSRIPYWSEDGKIGNPSKFDLNLPPILYMELANQIFQKENLNNEKNKRPDLFDSYVSQVKFRDSPKVEYTLFIYKGTTIIHTMFISWNKKPFNKKKILDLRQGWTSNSENMMTRVVTYEIPYFDIQETERFKIILRSNQIQQIDRWYVQVNNIDGIPSLTTFIKEIEVGSQLAASFRMHQLDFCNITWIEKEIKKMLVGKFKY